MNCDRFWELKAEGKDRDPTIRLALDAHLATCAECRADVAAIEADDDGDPGVSDEVLKKEVAAIFAKAGIAPTPPKTKPRPALLRAFAMAASLLLCVGLGITGGYGLRPQALELPRITLSGTHERLWLAHRAIDLECFEDAHDLARRVLATQGIAPAESAEATRILGTKAPR